MTRVPTLAVEGNRPMRTVATGWKPPRTGSPAGKELNEQMPPLSFSLLWMPLLNQTPMAADRRFRIKQAIDAILLRYRIG